MARWHAFYNLMKDIIARIHAHWEIGQFPTRKPSGSRNLWLQGSWHPDCCWVGNCAISQWVWTLAFIPWQMEWGHRVWGNCAIPLTHFLQWFQHWSWDNTRESTVIWVRNEDVIIAGFKYKQTSVKMAPVNAGQHPSKVEMLLLQHHSASCTGSWSVPWFSLDFTLK